MVDIETKGMIEIESFAELLRLKNNQKTLKFLMCSTSCHYTHLKGRLYRFFLSKETIKLFECESNYSSKLSNNIFIWIVIIKVLPLKITKTYKIE